MSETKATRKIAVAGATGRLGRHVVDVLGEQGHEVVPMSRATGVDLITGEGLAEALQGVDTIVDVATGPSPEEQAATEFFTTAARHLHEEGAKAGVEQVVAVSIIGIDGFTAGYSAAKLAHERAHLEGALPARILRAAQFHEFVGMLVDWGTQGDVAYVQDMPTQLVAARTVAEVLAALATAPGEPSQSPAGEPFPEVAGPQPERMADAARLLVAHRGDGLEVVGVANEDDPDHDLYERGALLPGPHASLAGPTFAEWLAST